MVRLLVPLILALLTIGAAGPSFAQPKCAKATPTEAQRRQIAQARFTATIPIPATNLQVQHVVYRDVSFFETGCPTVNAMGQAALEDFARYAQGGPPFTHLLVVGHADSGGDPIGERARTQRRAEAGVEVLRRLGLPATYLTSGLGFDQPRQLNLSSSEKAINRRLEFFLGASAQGVRIAAGLESPLEGKQTRPLLPSLTTIDQAGLPTAALGALRGAGLLR
ncbi:MAG TPA: hypothetical protein VGE72_03750 [Azospirillum sp.]